MTQVSEIQSRAADLENAAQIVPLALGGFATRPIPFKFAEDSILGSRDSACDWLGAEGSNLSKSAPVEFASEQVRFWS